MNKEETRISFFMINLFSINFINIINKQGRCSVCLSSVCFSHFSFSRKQVFGHFTRNCAISFTNTALFVQQFSLRFLGHVFDLASHALITNARLAAWYFRATAHIAFGIFSSSFDWSMRFTSSNALVVVGLNE